MTVPSPGARHARWWGLLACIALAGCDGSLSDQLADEGAFRALHAAPDLHEVRLRVENTARRDIGDAEYAEDIEQLRVGEARYEFSIRRVLPGDNDFTDILNFTQEIGAGRLYTFVLTGTAQAPERLTWTSPLPEFAEGTDGLAAAVGHAARGAPAVDVYLGAPGFDPAAALPVASLAFGEHVPGLELAAGDYQLLLTARGDPAQRLFESATFELFAATDLLFAVLAGADTGTAPLFVRVLGAGPGGVLLDQGSLAELRAVRGALGTDPVDVALAGNLAAPIAAALEFRADAAYAQVSPGTRELLVTDAGNPGAPLADAELALDGGSRLSAYLTGEPGDLALVTVADDNRRLADLARLRVFHSAAGFPLVDVFVVEAGEDFTRFAPTVQDLEFRNSTGALAAPPDDYDVVVTVPNTATVLAGPVRISLAAGAIFGVMAVDTVAGDSIELVVVDDL